MAITKKNLIVLLLLNTFIQGHNLRINTINNLHSEKSSNIAYIHCHGLGGNQNQALYYYSDNRNTQRPWILTTPLITFDFPDVKHNGKQYENGYNKQKVNLGQQQDVESLTTVYKSAQKQFPDYSFVGHGVSRGAATWLNFCALHKPEKICALIIESPFDDPLTLVGKFIPCPKDSDENEKAKILKNVFPLWNPIGYKPVDLVEKIPTNIPLLFIHSDQDSLISFKSSELLCKKLAESKHDVYLLILKSGGEHANIFGGKQGRTYTNVVHAFYKKIGLPHNPAWAQEGKSLLEHCKIH